MKMTSHFSSLTPFHCAQSEPSIQSVTTTQPPPLIDTTSEIAKAQKKKKTPSNNGSISLESTIYLDSVFLLGLIPEWLILY